MTGTEYVRRGFNDNGCIDSKDNCSMVVEMDRFEDYYACVRGYSNKTGSYTLKIEPNQNKTSYKNYGVMVLGRTD